MTALPPEAYRELDLPVLRDRNGATAAYRPDTTSFMSDGACRDYSPDLFDTDTNHGRTRLRGSVVIDGKTMKKKDQLALARRVCALCAVIDNCRAYIGKYPENEGVWAGTIPEERRSW